MRRKPELRDTALSIPGGHGESCRCKHGINIQQKRNFSRCFEVKKTNFPVTLSGYDNIPLYKK